MGYDTKTIRVFHTHIEISPYEKGEEFKIEKRFCTWDNLKHRYVNGVYLIKDETLYLPRGMDVAYLENYFNTKAIMMYDHDPYRTFKDANMTVAPRDDLQKDCINFLTASGKYSGFSVSSQQALILQTGFGKTYCMVNAIISMKARTMIITTQDKIKEQWIKTFYEKTDIDHDRLINIVGSGTMDGIIDGSIEGDIYFVNHQTLQTYARNKGEDALKDFFREVKIGIKVYDEAHLCFRNVIYVDYFSDTVRTYYLTANFTRSDDQEAHLYERCFASVYRYRSNKALEETSTAVSRKHILYYPITYRSNPTSYWKKKCDTYKGFSSLLFAMWAFDEDPKNSLMKVLLQVFEETKKHKGKILITVPKIDNINYICEYFKKHPEILDGRSIGTIHSKNKKEENEMAKSSVDVIISTIQSCGTGVDIKDLRSIINTTPFSSKIIANQLSGRLREYSPTDDTYFYDLIDIGFEPCERQLVNKLPILRAKCKGVFQKSIIP